MTGARIIIFAKAPVPGHAKTRLIPALGPEGAAELARRMLFDTCREALAAGVGPVELCLAHHLDWDEEIPRGVALHDKGEGGLGSRLRIAAPRAETPSLFIGTHSPNHATKSYKHYS